VPSGSNKNNYANVDLIVDIAVSQKVDGVWPGWGHASENPRLPSTLKTKGIQFIGPTAPVMAALGDKVSANILAQTADVPSIPWSGGGIKSGLNAEGVIPQEVFNSACVAACQLLGPMGSLLCQPDSTPPWRMVSAMARVRSGCGRGPTPPAPPTPAGANCGMVLRRILTMRWSWRG
jgi:hypothetical protein